MRRKDDAVSPVVGVLLMLVVCIIIAAVVSGFAGGLVSEEEKAPQVALDTSVTVGDSGALTLVIKHKSGDPINTKNVKLVTTWTNATNEINYAETVAPTWVEVEETYSPGYTSHYSLTSLNTLSWGNYYNEPYLLVSGDMPADGTGQETELWYGNFVFKPGDIMKVAENFNDDNGHPIIKNKAYLTKNDILTVKMVDLNSNKVLYDKDIFVKRG